MASSDGPLGVSISNAGTGVLTLPSPTGPSAPGPDSASPARHAGRRQRISGVGVGGGLIVMYLSLIVLIPLAAVVYRGTSGGWSSFWTAISSPEASAALKLTIIAGLIVAAINFLFGTLIAWVLIRDDFPGKGLVDVMIDLPFALPTIVAGLVLLTLYGPESPIGISLAYQRIGVIAALLFVTLPFVVRTVQPVLLELDHTMEEGAASLGASRFTIFRRIILPNLWPAILSGTALSFARAISEFGSTVLISGNIPLKTQVAAVQIYNQIESDNVGAAAAVSTVLLVVALVVLVSLNLVQRWAVRRG
jgi:sulfate transport system permease protein